MLDRLLGMLAQGGAYTPGELAHRLDVSERLVEHMLADLSRMGYLRVVSGGACEVAPADLPEPCADCPLASACAVCQPEGQVWALTEKAFQLVGS